jgi:hypothetical protein
MVDRDFTELARSTLEAVVCVRDQDGTETIQGCGIECRVTVSDVYASHCSGVRITFFCELSEK